jgi:hypothetical protein
MTPFTGASRRRRKSRDTVRSQNSPYVLSIDSMIERSRERSIIESRKNAIERLGLTEWRIWKFLHIEWQ